MGPHGKQVRPHRAAFQRPGKEAVHDPTYHWAGWEAHAVRDHFSKRREADLEGGEEGL